jgi:hypothetical protein
VHLVAHSMGGLVVRALIADSNRGQAFSAYLDLLMTGTTRRLPASPPRISRDQTREDRVFVLPVLPPTDCIPAPADLTGIGFGGSVRRTRAVAHHAVPMIEVSISHGDLCYARHPVMVGPYMGDSIISAEAALDGALQGSLKRCLDMGLYPGRLNTHRVFLMTNPGQSPKAHW